MKKNVVLFILFVLPIVTYLFFASGVTNFGRLPTLSEAVMELPTSQTGIEFRDKISILGFLGKDISSKKGNAFNLNEKIYKRFHEFKDFQFVMVVPLNASSGIEELKSELEMLGDISKWNFVLLDDLAISRLFDSLETNLTLDTNLGSPYVFIVDKKGNLRGRQENAEEDVKYGYDTSSVADLNNNMVDDVKIILAEYRLALKKNNAERSI